MDIKQIIEKNSAEFAQIFPFDLNKSKVFQLDFSVDNKELYSVNLLNTDELDKYIQSKLKKSNSEIGIGGYAENRLIYKRSEHFGKGDDSRSIHLGIDIWYKVQTPLFAFADSIVHSFQINDNFGDYGPTIILQHILDNVTFYTLYGHLAKESLNDLYIGKKIAKGQQFAKIGNSSENGSWPPHLHFQLITNMMGKKGDFFGVCSPSEKAKFLEICPNPNIILKYG